MPFANPEVKSVFRTYEARRSAEILCMKELGSEGFARRDEFLLPIGPDVGTFLHSLILARRPRRILEVGTSYGYSTLFLADAARVVGAQVVSLELADYKQAFAQEQLDKAGLSDVVEFQLGDAVSNIRGDRGTFDFVLLDIWKELYLPCFEAFYPKLQDEGVICADNMVSPESARPEVRVYRAAVKSKTDLHTTLLPVGSGVELTVRWCAGNTKL